MWPFTKRNKPTADPLTQDVDLAQLAPFREVERYLVVWPNSLAQSYALAIVYEARRGERVHIVHSPGYQHGGAMETHCEWLGTTIRQRDPAAVGLFIVWPRESGPFPEKGSQLIRVWFTPNESGVGSPRQTFLMSEDAEGNPQIDNVFTKPAVCFYDNTVFDHPRLGPDHWAKVLGCPIDTFSEDEWVIAADQVDPGRVQRAAVEQGSQDAYDAQMAWMKEMGVYGDEPESDPQLEEQLEPSEELKDRLRRCWSREPADFTGQVGGYAIGGANVGNPHHPGPVVSLFLPEDSRHELPIDLGDFRGVDVDPPVHRRIRLWADNLLTVEHGDQWRLIVFTGADFFPPWWFDAAGAPASERPHGVVTVRFADEPAVVDGEPQDLVDLGDAVGLAHLEDCRSLG